MVPFQGQHLVFLLLGSFSSAIPDRCVNSYLHYAHRFLRIYDRDDLCSDEDTVSRASVCGQGQHQR